MATHENNPRRARRQRLTDAVVRDLDPSKPRIVYDTDQKGFGIRLSPTSRSWILGYSLNRRERRATIGAWPTWNAKQARARAMELRRLVDIGQDPLQQRQAEASAPTVAELLDLYEQVMKAAKRSWSDDASMIRTYIRPRWQHRKVASIDGADVEQLHTEISKGAPIRANRVISCASAVFGLAIKRRWITTNPAHGCTRNKEARRERFLSIDEIARLVEALDHWPDTRSAVAVKLLLLLGCRRGELLRAHWREIDMVGRVWRKPAQHCKSGKAHTIPLSVEAIRELEKLPRHNSTDLLFRNSAGNPWSEIAAWPEIRRAAGLNAVRLHDLRHSAASLLISQGVPLAVISGVLGHASVAMSSRYSHLHDHALRDAVDGLGKAIAEAAD